MGGCMSTPSPDQSSGGGPGKLKQQHSYGTSYQPPAPAQTVQTAFGKDAYQLVGQLGTGRNGERLC